MLEATELSDKIKGHCRGDSRKEVIYDFLGPLHNAPPSLEVEYGYGGRLVETILVLAVFTV